MAQKTLLIAAAVLGLTLGAAGCSRQESASEVREDVADAQQQANEQRQQINRQAEQQGRRAQQQVVAGRPPDNQREYQ